MVSIRYESLYIFLVSLGIIIFIIPFVLIFLFTNGFFDTLLTIEDLANFTPETLEILQNKQNIIIFIMKNFNAVLLICFVVGAGCFVYGIIKWTERQKIVDSIDITELQLAQKKLESMDDNEILERKKEEIANDNKPKNNKRNNNKYDVNKKLILDTKHDFFHLEVEKEITIEDNYYSFLCKKRKEGYRYKKDVKIPKTDFAFDIIAESKNRSFDVIYELKTWENIPDKSVVERTFYQLYSSMKFYSNWRNIQCRGMIVVFTKKENIHNIEKILSNNIQPNIIRSRIHLAVYDINDFVHSSYLD